MNTSYGARTDVGAVRELNEDAVVSSPPVFAVADGMGGHAAGEVAAGIAARSLAALAGRGDLRSEDILAAIEAANESILAVASQRVETAGMGTTVSGLCLGRIGGTDHWFVFNVGDSRVYRLAGGKLTQITTDHSEVAELIAAGHITADEAKSHPLRSVVTRSLGSDPAPTPDVWVLPATEGERFLVCSDGLPLELSEPEIAGILARPVGAQGAADALVEAAVAAGGRDNVSAVVVDVSPTIDRQPADVTTAPRRAISGGHS